MGEKWRGIIPALSTPTDEKGELDEESLRSEVRFNIAWGSHSLAPSIVAGEFYKFTDAERLKIFDVVVDEARGKVPVLPGVHHSGTEPAVRFAKYAKDVGADGIIVMAPYYSRNLDQNVLRRHFGTIAERVDLPVMIQDTGVEPNLSPKLYQILAEEYSNVVSVKVEGANTLEKIVDTKELLGDRLTIIGGMAARFIFEELALGADGNIPDACLTDLLTDVYKNIKSGNMVKAKEMFARYKVWLEFLSSHPGASAEIEKETLRLRGAVRCSQTRGPNVPLEEMAKLKLRELLVSIGLVS